MIKTVVDVAWRRLICLVVSLPLTYLSLAILVLLTEPHRDGALSERELWVLISFAVLLQFAYFFLAAAVMGTQLVGKVHREAAGRWTGLGRKKAAPDQAPVNDPSSAPVGLVIKRLMDVIVSALLLVLEMPLFLAISLAIKTAEPGQPVFYRQTRVAPNGRTFITIKFRTLSVHAEPPTKPTNVHGLRLTSIGVFLRKTRLDELPLLWCVLRGDMSLVGPPAIPLQAYERWRQEWSSIHVKPGITGRWQTAALTTVTGGPDALPFEVWMSHEKEYAEHWSLWRDLEILARTISTVVGFSRRQRLEVDIRGNLFTVPA